MQAPLEIVAPLLTRCQAGRAAIVLVVHPGADPPASLLAAVEAALRKEGALLWRVRLPELAPNPVQALVELQRREAGPVIFSILCPGEALREGEEVAALNIHRNSFARERLCALFWVPATAMRDFVGRAANFLDFRTRTVEVRDDGAVVGSTEERPRTEALVRTEAAAAPPPLSPEPVHRISSPFSQVTWAPDGRRFAAYAGKPQIAICDVDTGQNIHVLSLAPGPYFRDMEWSPDGASLACVFSDGTLRIWDTATWRPRSAEPRSQLGGRPSQYAIRWSPDGALIAVAMLGGAIELRAADGSFIRGISVGVATSRSFCWSPGGERLICCDAHGGMLAIAIDSQTVSWSVHVRPRPGALGCSPDGRLIATGYPNVKIWAADGGRLIAALEDLTGHPAAIAFSPDSGLLLALTWEGTFHIWRCDTWALVMRSQAFLPPEAGLRPTADLAVLPARNQVAVLRGDGISLWKLDPAPLLLPRPPRRSYTNAKVMLLGDSGVGKSALALRLTGQPFRPTESTHARHVYTLDRLIVEQEGRVEDREVLLWDMAGQPGYRLLHQLHLHQASVALVVFDAQSDLDPLAGVRHWDRALRLAERLRGEGAPPIKKYLVAARTDRGGVRMSRARVLQFARDLGFAGYLETSARAGEGITELGERIRAAIDWDALPRTYSPDLFVHIKEFMLDEKARGRLLAQHDELYRDLLRARGMPAADLSAEFATCVRLLTAQDLVRPLRFGGILLLQPEFLDAYAAALLHAAREEPDGLGAIGEEDALAGRFRIALDERVVDRASERLLLIAMIEELLRHELALREETLDGAILVFPAQLLREHPDLPDPEGKSVIYSFEGPLLQLYATLVVRLSHSGLFQKEALWRDAATFSAPDGGRCGIYLRQVDEGRGELCLFFAAATGTAARVQFDEYVHLHLQHRALPRSLRRRRIFICAQCGTPVADIVVVRRRARGGTSVRCPVCEAEVSIVEARWEAAAAPSEAVLAMDLAADQGRDREVARTLIRGKRATDDYDVYLCHQREDAAAVKRIGEMLLDAGLLPWLEERDAPRRIRVAAVFVGASGVAPWQRFVEQGCAIIPVLLPGPGPGIDQPLELPPSLQSRGWIDLRGDDPDELQRLISRITAALPI